MASSNEETGRAPFSWRRTWALAVAIALHSFAFLLLIAPPAPPKQAEAKKERIVQVNFIEPPPPPTPPPPPRPEPPKQPPPKIIQQVTPPPTPPPPAPPPAVEEQSTNAIPAPPPAPPAPPAPPSDITASQDLSYNNQIKPKYPPQAMRQRHEGTVTLLVLVGVDGSVKDVKVETSSGYRELDRAAMDAVRRWRFNAEVKNGQKVEGYARVPVNFSLNQL